MSHTLPQCRVRIRIPHYSYRVYGISALLYKFIKTNIASTGHNFSTLQIGKAESSILKIKPRFHIRGMRHCSVRFVCFHINEYPCVFRIQPSDSDELLHWAIRFVTYGVARVKSRSCVYMCYISCRIHIIHTVYMESRLYTNTTRNGTHLNVRAWFHMRDYRMRQNGSLNGVWFVGIDDWNLNFTTQAGFPKGNRSGGGGVSKNAWIPQCRIYRVYGISALRVHISSINGKACKRMRASICPDTA